MSPIYTPGKLTLSKVQLDARDADANAYMTAVQAADGQPLELGVRLAITDFVLGCKADGIWTAIKASCILAGARTLAGALVPLAGTAPVNFNFVSGDYNRKTGLLGDGTKHLDSNRNNNADPQDSQHMCVYQTVLHTSGSARVLIGAGATTDNGCTRIAESSTTVRLAIHRNRNDVFGDTNAGIALGFCGMSRSLSTEYVFRGNGSNDVDLGDSETPYDGNVYIFAANIASTASNFSNSRLSFYSIGESLDLALLDARVTALYNAIGAAF